MVNIVLNEQKQKEVRTILMSFPISELDRVQELIKILNESLEVVEAEEVTEPKIKKVK